MKDSYTFDIDDAGLQKSYDAHREAYIKIFDRLGLFEHALSCTPCQAPWGSASEEFWPSRTPARTPSSSHRAGTRPTSRLCTSSRRSRCRSTTPRPVHVHDTPDTPTIETLVNHANDHVARDDRSWTAADTLKNVAPMVRKLDGTRAPLAIGLPGDREVDMKRLAATLEPDEAVAVHRRGFRRLPEPGQGLYRSRCAGGEQRLRHPLSDRSAGGRRDSLVTGADQPGRHVFDLVSPVATSPPTASSTSPR